MDLHGAPCSRTPTDSLGPTDSLRAHILTERLSDSLSIYRLTEDTKDSLREDPYTGCGS